MPYDGTATFGNMTFCSSRRVMRPLVVVGLLSLPLGVAGPATADNIVHIGTDAAGERIVSQITVRYRAGVERIDAAGRPAGTSAIRGVELGFGSEFPNDIWGIVMSPGVSGSEAERIAATMEASGAVEFADVMYPFDASATDQWQTCTVATSGAIDDSCLDKQKWYLDAIGAPEVWGTSADSPHAVVAVIDSGSLNHPDLSGRWVNGRDMIARSRQEILGSFHDVNGFTSGGDGDGEDDDPTDQGQGRTDAECFTGGVNWYLNLGTRTYAPARSSNWHGTAVASIVAATQDNQIGMSGVAPRVKVQAVRALGRCIETDDVLNLVRAIDWAAGVTVDGSTNPTPAHVINMSLGAYYGGSDRCPTVYQEAISRALAKGSVVVASAGNESKPAAEHVPSSCSGVISVGATNRSSALSSFSSTDPDVSAPGGEVGVDLGDTILVASNTETGALTSPVYSYRFGSGTSYSAPMVSAAIAMAMTKYKTAGSRINPASLKAALLHAASLGTTCDDCGAGILHIPTFLDVLAATSAPTTPLLVTGTPVQNSTSSVSVSWNPPMSNLWNPITSYTARAHTAASGGTVAGSCSPASVETTSCVISGLAENTTYHVSVTATVTASTQSDRVEARTRRRAPAPTGVTGTGGSGTINLSWNAVEDAGDFSLMGLYEGVAYSSETGTTVAGSCYASGTTCEIGMLSAGTPYWVTVSAMTGFHPGGSVQSPRIRVVTAGSPSPTTTVPKPTPTTTVPKAPSTPQVTVKVGKSITAATALARVGLKASKGSKTTLAVPSSQKSTCRVSGSTVTLRKKGSCTITVTLKPLRGASSSRKLILKS